MNNDLHTEIAFHLEFLGIPCDDWDWAKMREVITFLAVRQLRDMHAHYPGVPDQELRGFIATGVPLSYQGLSAARMGEITEEWRQLRTDKTLSNTKRKD